MITRNGEHYFVEGPVTHASVGSLLAEGIRSFEGGHVVVDFSRVAKVDSSAVSLMLEWGRQMRGSQREIVYANLGESLSSLVDLYGVAELIPLSD